MKATVKEERRFTLDISETQAEHLKAVLGILDLGKESPLNEVFDALEGEVDTDLTFSDLYSLLDNDLEVLDPMISLK